MVTKKHKSKQHTYTIRYDDGVVVEHEDLVSQHFRIIDGEENEYAAASSDAAKGDTSDDEQPHIEEPSPRGDRKPDANLSLAILLSKDNDFEIYWGKVDGWRLYCPDRERIAFYEWVLESHKCEVEWDNNGLIYDTYFREVNPRKRKRKKLDRYNGVDMISPKKKKAKARNKTSNGGKTASPEYYEYNASLGLGSDPMEHHYVTTELNMTRKKLISTLPEDMRALFAECCWVPWRQVHRPALCLSPFEVSGSGGIVKEWTNTYRSHQRSGTLSQMPYLVYWYEQV